MLILLGRVKDFGDMLLGKLVLMQLLVKFGFLKETGLLTGQRLHLDCDFLVLVITEENVAESAFAESLF